jgi:hypothetical protein
MFKYISNILSQFTPAQRILALLILVLSVIIITLGPSLIGAITLDRTELTKDLNNKETRINFLEKKIDTLSDQIIESRRSCTDEITSREEEFVRMLDRLKKELESSAEPSRRMLRLERTETLGVEEESYSKPMIIETSKPNQKALKMIEQMKLKCKTQK